MEAVQQDQLPLLQLFVWTRGVLIYFYALIGLAYTMKQSYIPAVRKERKLQPLHINTGDNLTQEAHHE